ncbi:hypothetical protein D9M72_472760 [compost metagenome]
MAADNGNFVAQLQGLAYHLTANLAGAAGNTDAGHAPEATGSGPAALQYVVQVAQGTLCLGQGLGGGTVGCRRRRRTLLEGRLAYSFRSFGQIKRIRSGTFRLGSFHIGRFGHVDGFPAGVRARG